MMANDLARRRGVGTAAKDGTRACRSVVGQPTCGWGGDAPDGRRTARDASRGELFTFDPRRGSGDRSPLHPFARAGLHRFLGGSIRTRWDPYHKKLENPGWVDAVRRAFLSARRRMSDGGLSRSARRPAEPGKWKALAPTIGDEGGENPPGRSHGGQQRRRVGAPPGNAETPTIINSRSAAREAFIGSNTFDPEKRKPVCEALARIGGLPPRIRTTASAYFGQ